MTKINILNSYKQEEELLENSIKNLYDGKKELIILEAGCGRRWPLNLSDIRYKLIGVDLDNEALKSRVNDVKDLDEAIVADLQYFDIGHRKVDVIYNSFVLEHVGNAELMLVNFNKILKPGGLLILKFPDRNTVFGFITRITPFWFHIFYKKYIEGIKNAGKPGYPPYPTIDNKILCIDGIRNFCKSYGFIINQEYGTCAYLYKNNLRTKLIRIIVILVNIMSIGKLPWKYGALQYVLTKV